jgi:hypothetical protein
MARPGDRSSTTNIGPVSRGQQRADPADVALVACIALGAVVGFELTGSAALGTLAGGAVGLAAGALIHRREGSVR